MNGWIKLNKTILSLIDKCRPYTKVEAAISYAIDKDNRTVKSLSEYQRIWDWNSRGKVRRFIEKINGQLADSKRTGSGQVFSLVNNELKQSTDRRRTANGQKADTYYKTKTKTKTNNKDITSSCCNSKEFQLSKVLADKILKNNPKHKDLSNGKFNATVMRWSKDIEKMLRIDKRTEKDVLNAINFSQSDNFWQCNILSGKKLREKYDALYLKMNKNTKAWENI